MPRAVENEVFGWLNMSFPTRLHYAPDLSEEYSLRLRCKFMFIAETEIGLPESLACHFPFREGPETLLNEHTDCIRRTYPVIHPA